MINSQLKCGGRVVRSRQFSAPFQIWIVGCKILEYLTLNFLQSCAIYNNAIVHLLVSSSFVIAISSATWYVSHAGLHFNIISWLYSDFYTKRTLIKCTCTGVHKANKCRVLFLLFLFVSEERGILLVSACFDTHEARKLATITQHTRNKAICLGALYIYMENKVVCAGNLKYKSRKMQSVYKKILPYLFGGDRQMKEGIFVLRNRLYK